MSRPADIRPLPTGVHTLEPVIQSAQEDELVVVPVEDHLSAARLRASGSHCANCGVVRTGAFCPACGQRHQDERLTVRRVLRDLTARLLDLESGFFHTVYRLTVAPGIVARDYVAGRRQRYVGPATYLLVITTLSILAFALVKDDYVRFMEATWIPALPKEILDAAQSTGQSDAFAATLTRWLSQGTLYLSLFMAGFFAVLMRWVLPRWRQRYNVAETWVFAIYATAHGFLLSLPLYGLVSLDLALMTRFMLLAVLLIGVATVYMAIAAAQFLDRRWTTGLTAGGIFLGTIMLSSWVSAGIGLAIALLTAG